MVGQTTAGDPIFEVRSVRLVLSDNATHFNRLATCVNCGRETPGAAVRTPADLDVPAAPVTCMACRGAASGPGPDEVVPEVDGVRAERERLDALEARLDQLEAVIESGRAEATRVAGTAERVIGGLAKVGTLVDSTSQRLVEVEHRVEAVLASVAESAVSQRLEWEAALAGGLDEVRSAIPAPDAANEERLQAVERRAAQTQAEMAELGDLHAALDVGLGQLRTEIGAVRDAQTGLTEAQDLVDSRLDAVSAVQQAMTAEAGKGGRRGGKRSVELVAQLAAVSAATDQLARDFKQLHSQVAVIEMAADGAAAAATRAGAQAAAVVRLQADVDDLHDRLDALTDSLEQLRRERPAPAPAAKKASRAKKG